MEKEMSSQKGGNS